MADDPRELSASSTEPGGARDHWTEDRTTFQRVYDVMTGVTEYATASTVADRAACSTDGARDALAQLVEMGIVEQQDGRPVEYRRNNSYFRWKRIDELATEHSATSLRSQLEDLLAEDEAFQEQFDAPNPDSISPTEFETTDHDQIHDRLDAVRRWRSTRNDIEVLQQAIHRAEQQHTADDTASP